MSVYSFESLAIAVPSSFVTSTIREPIGLDASNVNLNPEICGKRPSPGFKINVTREFWKNNTIVETENFLTSYRPSDNIICLKEGEVAPTEDPSAQPAASGVPQPVPQN